MIQAIQVLTVILVSIAMALALSHALELPGKMRLARQNYFAVQPIYYPGYTIGGAVGEFGGLLAALVLLAVTPSHTDAFWLTLVSFLALLGMQCVYWVLIHPINKVWLRGAGLGSAGEGFFGFDPIARPRTLAEFRPIGWTGLRDRWEYAHVIRAVLGLTALILLVIAVTY
jgi:hypothetical protein